MSIDLGKGELPKHHWALRYLLDWGRCGKDLKPIRAYTTALRWYAHPGKRHRVLTHMRTWSADTEWRLLPQHERNLDELISSFIAVGPSWPAARMGAFLNRLKFGDIIRGGRTPDTVPGWITRTRPGYAWFLGQWLAVFPGDPCPWPWWIWLSPAEIARLP